MATIIKYNGVDIFSGIAPTPFVARKVEPVRFGSKWGVKESFTLNGEIVSTVSPCAEGSFSDLIGKTTRLANLLSPDLGEFEIIDDEVSVLKKPVCKIVSFNCDDDKTYAVKPFTIEIETYDSKHFKGIFGVLDPSNEISYAEGDDGFISISHTVSAKGFKTESKSAMQSAIDYVTGAIDIANVNNIIEKTGRIKSGGSVVTSPRLISINEQINRFESSYSLTKKYLADAKTPSSTVLFKSSYDISYSEEEGIYTITLSGSFQGGILDNFSTVQSKMTSITSTKAFELCSTAIKKVYSGVALNPNINSKKVDEDPVQKTITFTYSFNSDVSAGVAYLEGDTTITYDDLTSSYEVSFSGEVRGKKGQRPRWTDVLNIYKSLNIQALCQKALSEEESGKNLETVPKSYSSSFNERAGTISINASYSEINPNNKWSTTYKDFTYSLEFTPTLYQLTPMQTLFNGTKVVDIECKKRAELSINGSAQVKDFCLETDYATTLKSTLLSIVGMYAKNYFIESINISRTRESSDSYTFSLNVSYMEDAAFAL